jgi:DNA-binding beta-propeller fold protein YncE
MPLLVTSASDGNGNGYGALLAFGLDGRPLGAFSDDPRITDPRGLAIHPNGELLYLNSGADRVLAIDRAGNVLRDTGVIAGLNLGGGTFGPDGRYYAGLRSVRTIMAFPEELGPDGQDVLPQGVVPFPRGFAFARDGKLFMASGIGPNGEGDDTIIAFGPGGATDRLWTIKDPELSPLDVAIAPNGNIIVSSEQPFGAIDAVTTVREYAGASGRLVRVFAPEGSAELRRPRGLRFGPDRLLYCVGQDEVVVFDFAGGTCLGPIVWFPRLNGQAVAFFP